MMKKFLWGVCLWLIATTAGAQTLKKASDAQAKAMTEKINHTAAGIKTLSCTFTQVKTLQFLNDKMTSQGRMYFDASGKLRWEYTSPYKYTFVLNGQKVYIQSAQSSQTIDISQSRLFQSIAQVMMNSVTGKSLNDGGDFRTAMYTDGKEWVAALTPLKKEMKKMFKDIRLHFSSEKQMVTRVDMTEPGGDTTVITLKDVRTNTKVDEKMFAH